MTHPEHRHGDDDTITVTRSVPLTWVLSAAGAAVSSILIWATSQHFGQKEIAKEVAAMSLKVEATTAIAIANNSKTTELQIHFAELRRRVEVLERKP